MGEIDRCLGVNHTRYGSHSGNLSSQEESEESDVSNTEKVKGERVTRGDLDDPIFLVEFPVELFL